MTRFQRFVFGLVASGVAAEAGAAGLLLTGGRIYTGTDAQPRVEAVLAVDGRIAFAGAAAEARRRAPAGTRVVELGTRVAYPGFTDAHVHLLGIGERELSFSLDGTASLAELQAKLRRRAETTPATEARGWIVGRGWIESQWKPAVFPTRQDLDAVVRDRPVILARADGHAAVVNTRALELAGIDRTTPNPDGGEILRDAQGEATGMLIDRAIGRVHRLVPPPTPADMERALAAGAAREVELGWTQVQIAGLGTTELAAIRRLVGEGRTALRIYAAIGGPGAAAEELIARGATDDGRVTVRGIKVSIDGALGSRGAALLAPYADEPGKRGLMMYGGDVLLPFYVRALRAGIQIQTHAIGDAANRAVLDLYAQAFAAVPPAERKVAEPRWRIEHAQVLAPEDLPRLAKLGVIASMQPSHAIGDLVFAPSRLGQARLAGAYAWRSLLDSGAVIAGGSDAPVEKGEPMIEFYAAAVRKSVDGFADENWHREQRVTRAEALRMLTLAPAFAAFQEKERGTIEAGKLADFTVLSADILEIPDAEILRTECVMTVIGGAVAWERAKP